MRDIVWNDERVGLGVGGYLKCLCPTSSNFGRRKNDRWAQPAARSRPERVGEFHDQPVLVELCWICCG